jgi:ParB family chromosome partitioning protein
VGETIAAFGQLAALGQSPARIARRSHTPRKTVDHALAAAASEVAAKAAERWDFLTLDDATYLAEFDDDPDAVKTLVTAAKSGENTAHVAQRLRDQRDTTHAIAALTTQLKDAGVPVIGEPPYDEKTIRPCGTCATTGGPSRPSPTPTAPGTPPTSRGPGARRRPRRCTCASTPASTATPTSPAAPPASPVGR